MTEREQETAIVEAIIKAAFAKAQAIADAPEIPGTRIMNSLLRALCIVAVHSHGALVHAGSEELRDRSTALHTMLAKRVRDWGDAMKEEGKNGE